jgi:hypothetical protein
VQQLTDHTCPEVLLKTLVENEMVIAGHTLLVSATIHSILDDRGDVVITGITGITVNGMLPGPRLAQRIEDTLVEDDGLYEELCMTQPTKDQLMLEWAEAEYDAGKVEQEMFGGSSGNMES